MSRTKAHSACQSDKPTCSTTSSLWSVPPFPNPLPSPSPHTLLTSNAPLSPSTSSPKQLQLSPTALATLPLTYTLGENHALWAPLLAAEQAVSSPSEGDDL